MLLHESQRRAAIASGEQEFFFGSVLSVLAGIDRRPPEEAGLLGQYWFGHQLGVQYIRGSRFRAWIREDIQKVRHTDRAQESHR